MAEGRKSLVLIGTNGYPHEKSDRVFADPNTSYPTRRTLANSFTYRNPLSWTDPVSVFVSHMSLPGPQPVALTVGTYAMQTS